MQRRYRELVPLTIVHQHQPFPGVRGADGQAGGSKIPPGKPIGQIFQSRFQVGATVMAIIDLQHIHFRKGAVPVAAAANGLGIKW